MKEDIREQVDSVVTEIKTLVKEGGYNSYKKLRSYAQELQARISGEESPHAGSLESDVCRKVASLLPWVTSVRQRALFETVLSELLELIEVYKVETRNYLIRYTTRDVPFLGESEEAARERKEHERKMKPIRAASSDIQECCSELLVLLNKEKDLDLRLDLGLTKQLDIELKSASRSIKRGENKMDLSPTEFKLLQHFLDSAHIQKPKIYEWFVDNWELFSGNEATSRGPFDQCLKRLNDKIELLNLRIVPRDILQGWQLTDWP